MDGSPRATILSLPVEIIGKILTLHLNAFGNGSLELFAEPIMQVCSYLRQALINTPSFWTTIKLDSQQTEYKLGATLARTQNAYFKHTTSMA